MNDYVYDIDKQLDNFLQKELVFKLNEQSFKRGQLIIYSHGYFTFLFTIRNHRKNKNEILKIPVPFSTTMEDNKVTFDYRIKTLFTGNKMIEDAFKEVKKPNISKFYDKLLTIEAI